LESCKLGSHFKMSRDHFKCRSLLVPRMFFDWCFEGEGGEGGGGGGGEEEGKIIKKEGGTL